MSILRRIKRDQTVVIWHKMATTMAADATSVNGTPITYRDAIRAALYVSGIVKHDVIARRNGNDDEVVIETINGVPMAITICIVDMIPDALPGKIIRGQWQAKANRILISMVGNDDSYELLRTILHELGHAYNRHATGYFGATSTASRFYDEVAAIDFTIKALKKIGVNYDPYPQVD